MPCIRCGYCADVCPVSLLPQQLLWYAKANDFNKLNDHQLEQCMHCNACTYVCPSNIPLVDYFKEAKKAIKLKAHQNEKASFAKNRYEQRKKRLEQQAFEKKRKRELAKKAKLQVTQLQQSENKSLNKGKPATAVQLQIKAIDRQLEKVQSMLKHTQNANAQSKLKEQVQYLTQQRQRVIDATNANQLSKS